MINNNKLKKTWKFPEIPKGFDKISLIIGTSGNIEIYYLIIDKNDKLKKMFSIEELDESFKIEWPFLKDYNPTKKDFEDLGFSIGKSFDNCFASVPKDIMFKDWLNKN